MRFGVLVSNNGKHSEEKLAIAVAGDIVQIGATASGQDALDGRKLENKIVEIMEAHFARLAEYEHAEIAAKGAAHLSTGPQGVEAHPDILDAATNDVCAAIASSPFASWFTADETKSHVRDVVEKWMRAAHHMHRDWFAAHGKVGHGSALEDAENHDPDDERVKAWRAGPGQMTIGLNLPAS